jgi:hypothetical protein
MLRNLTAAVIATCQRKCNGHPEERIDGACQSMKGNVVIYIHIMAVTQLPVLVPVVLAVVGLAVDTTDLAVRHVER